MISQSNTDAYQNLVTWINKEYVLNYNGSSCLKQFYFKNVSRKYVILRAKCPLPLSVTIKHCLMGPYSENVSSNFSLVVEKGKFLINNVLFSRDISHVWQLQRCLWYQPMVSECAIS